MLKMFSQRYFGWLMAALIIAYILRSGHLLSRVQLIAWHSNSTPDQPKQVPPTQPESINTNDPLQYDPHDVTAPDKSAAFFEPFATVESTAIVDLEAVHTHHPIPTEDIPVLAIETELAKGKLHTEDEFDGLLGLCNEIQWTDGLWLHCHSSAGANRKCWVGSKIPF